MDFETLRVRRDGAVWFADISAPPMNLLGTELVRDLVSLIQRAEADNACQIESRVRGAGSEFVLACDMRFAARESAIFSQPEQGFGLIPGAGGALKPNAFGHGVQCSLANCLSHTPGSEALESVRKERLA